MKIQQHVFCSHKVSSFYAGPNTAKPNCKTPGMSHAILQNHYKIIPFIANSGPYLN